jgi:cytochrome c peroxidase
VGGRQAPTVYNTAFNHLQFWDGRARSLEEQAIGPIQNPIEMGETHENVVSKLNKIKGYQQQFRAVFGTEVSLQGIAEAIAAYERTVISTNSAFDKYVAGDTKAMDEAAVRGMALFKGKARCVLCHNGRGHLDALSLWGKGALTTAQDKNILWQEPGNFMILYMITLK